jgi:cobalt-zinc-cadmium efflux system membrane fusion protein
MTTLFRPLAVGAVCAVALACTSNETAKTGTPPAKPEAAATEREAVANSVTIADEMLRDLRLTTTKVESRPGGEQIVLLGQLEVDQSRFAEVGAPVSSRVSRLHAGPGDTVRGGQTLAELTSPDLAKARAEYLSAEARVKLADAALERKRGLAKEKIAPLREVQEAEAAAAEAHASLRSARAAIAAFGVQPPTGEGDDGSSPRFVLRSPVSGSVIERTAVVGQMLDPATPAFRIGDLSWLWLMVHAFERDAVRIHKGITARVAFSAVPGQVFHGTVTVVGSHVESESRTVPVRIDVRNRGGILRPGMSATATLPVGSTGAPLLSVPVAAVQRVRNEWCVFLPQDAGRFEIRRIGRGRDLAGEVEVLSGLQAGELIVVDGAFLLKAQAEKGQAGHDDHGGGHD